MPGPDLTTPQPLSLEKLGDLTRIALFAALTGAGAFIHIPFGPMHISLQTMMVMLTGFVLGPRKAALAMLAYLACGLMGLPMFGRGRGPDAFFGPTAGYLPGFVLGSMVAGLSSLFAGNGKRHFLAMVVFGTLGSVILLLAGTAGVRLILTGDWAKAFAIGFVPYIGGDIVKMLAAAAVRRLFFPEKSNEAEGMS